MARGRKGKKRRKKKEVQDIAPRKTNWFTVSSGLWFIWGNMETLEPTHLRDQLALRTAGKLRRQGSPQIRLLGRGLGGLQRVTSCPSLRYILGVVYFTLLPVKVVGSGLHDT